MASTKNQSLDLIANYYKYFNNKDLEKFISLLDENVVHEINQGQTEKGKQVFQEFMLDMNSYYRENLTNIALMANDDGSRIGAEYVVHGTYLQSAPGLPPARGQTYTLAGGTFFEIKNNKISRVTNYYNAQKWLELVK